MTLPACQRTIARPVEVRGFGYWSGQDVCVRLEPSEADAGLVFVRSDVGPHARVEANVWRRVEASRRTVLESDVARVEMVEHVLAALAGLGIDNCVIQVDAAEMPGCDGSAQPFVEAIDRARIVELDAPRRYVEIEAPIRLGDRTCWIEAHPPQHDGLSLEFELDYRLPIGSQSICLAVTEQTFRTELAACRTFIFKEEAEALLNRGLGLRVTAQDLLIFDSQGPIENTLLFDDECVRHKALDLVGDLALAGCAVVGHIVAHRSGHQLNAALAEVLAGSACGALEQPIPQIF